MGLRKRQRGDGATATFQMASCMHPLSMESERSMAMAITGDPKAGKTSSVAARALLSSRRFETPHHFYGI